LLGEFGAEVIKVEQPGVGDDLRRLGRRPDGGGPAYMWLVESRNKKSITCNLREPDGQALIKRLAAQSDVLAENFRPGTMERWNLGWDDLRAVNAGLIMVRISAFGQTGPARERPGFGRIAAAVSGVSYLSGYPDRPPVTPGTPTIPDYLAGTMGALGALVALQHRQSTGEGQVVDVGLYEPTLRMLDELIPAFAATGHVRERIGSGTEYVVPHNHYRTRRELDRHRVNDRMFERLARTPWGARNAPGVCHRGRAPEAPGGGGWLVGAWVEQFEARGHWPAWTPPRCRAAGQQRARSLRRSPGARPREHREPAQPAGRIAAHGGRGAQAQRDSRGHRSHGPDGGRRAQRGDLLRSARPHPRRSRRPARPRRRVASSLSKEDVAP
jgi:hypothetical protein